MQQRNKSKIHSPELHALSNTEEESGMSEKRSSKVNTVSKVCCTWQWVSLTQPRWQLELEPDNLSARMTPLCLSAEEQRKTVLASLGAECLFLPICFTKWSESYQILLHSFERSSWVPARGWLQARLLG